MTVEIQNEALLSAQEAKAREDEQKRRQNALPVWHQQSTIVPASISNNNTGDVNASAAISAAQSAATTPTQQLEDAQGELDDAEADIQDCTFISCFFHVVVDYENYYASYMQQNDAVDDNADDGDEEFQPVTEPMAGSKSAKRKYEETLSPVAPKQPTVDAAADNDDDDEDDDEIFVQA